MHRRGFTLTELVVGLVIAAIVVLMVSAIGTIAVKSYNDLRKKSDVYNDSQFALQLIRESVRKSTSATLSVPLSGCLKAGTHSFYISGSTSLVDGSGCGINNCTCTSNKSIITGVTSLIFTPINVSGSPLVTVALSGSKVLSSSNKVAFSYSISAARRNP